MDEIEAAFVSENGSNGSGRPATDVDPQETREWLEAVDAVIAADGPDRAAELLAGAVGQAHRRGAQIETSGPTPYINTIHAEDQPELPGDPALERRAARAGPRRGSC